MTSYTACTTSFIDDEESTGSLAQVTAEHENMCMVSGNTICTTVCYICMSHRWSMRARSPLTVKDEVAKYSRAVILHFRVWTLYQL